MLGVLSLRWDRRIQCREVGDGWVAGPVTGAPRAVGARCVRIPALDPPLPSWHPRQRDAATIGLDSCRRVARQHGVVDRRLTKFLLELATPRQPDAGSFMLCFRRCHARGPLHRPVPRRTRLVMLMLAVYLAPLLVTAYRFDPAAPITYIFFGLVLTMTVAALWYLFEQPVIVPSESADSLAPTARVCRSLGLVAAVTALWGLALFVTDSGPSGSIWVWPGDLLTSRLIAVMLLTIAVGAVYALRSVDVSRVMLGVILQHSASCSSFPRPY